jgi:hypothetical protein
MTVSLSLVFSCVTTLLFYKKIFRLEKVPNTDKSNAVETAGGLEPSEHVT